MSLLTPPFTHKIFFSLNPSRGNRSSTWKLQTWVSFKLGWTFVMPAGFPNPGAVFQLHEAQCSRDFFPRDLCFSRKPQWRWDCLRDEKSLCAGTDQPEVAASPNLRKQVAAPPSSVLTLIAGAVQGTPLSPMRFARHPEIGMHGGSFPAALKLTQEDAFSSPCWVSSAVLLYFCLIIFVVSLSFYFCCIFFVLLFLLYSCLFIFFEFLSFFCCILVLLFLLCFFCRAQTFGGVSWPCRNVRGAGMGAAVAAVGGVPRGAAMLAVCRAAVEDLGLVNGLPTVPRAHDRRPPGAPQHRLQGATRHSHLCIRRPLHHFEPLNLQPGHFFHRESPQVQIVVVVQCPVGWSLATSTSVVRELG